MPNPPIAPHTTAPPFYRKADINPMTAILADKSTLAEFEGPPTVNLTSGSGTFGVVALETQHTLTYDFTSQGSEELFFLGVYVKYVGDNGAFRVDSIGGVAAAQALVSGTTTLVAAIPGSNSGSTLSIAISALAANNGVAKTGTLTFYDRYTTGPFTLGRSVGTLSLSKTYTP